MGPHTTSDDPSRYEDRVAREDWAAKDPIDRLGALLGRHGADDRGVHRRGQGEGRRRRRASCGPDASRWQDPDPLTRVRQRAHAAPSSWLERQKSQYAAYLANFEGGQLMTQMTMSQAINSGLRRALEDDPKVVLMGEDIGKLGGVFRVTDGLQKDFGSDRVMDTPLAEAGIIGTAVGLAFRGYRPVCEIQFDGFIYPGFDQIVAQVAKLHYRTRGNVKMPITIRVPFGGGIGAVEHHSESPEAYFAHTSGLRVISCSNPQDAHTMIRQAIASDDPVLFFEPKRRYWAKGEVDEEIGADTLSMESARVVVPGQRRHPGRLRPAGDHRPRCRAAPPKTTASPSRSSTCVRCRRSTSAPSRRRCARPAGS